MTIRKTFGSISDATNYLRSNNFVVKGKTWSSLKTKVSARISAVKCYGTKSRIIVVNFTL